MTTKSNKGIARFESGRGNELKILFPEVIEALPEYVIQFKLNTASYGGEFGFDWMRKDWLKEESDCVEGLDELKEIYTPFDLNISDYNGEPYGQYYVPWLTMFPNHKEKIGTEVKLIIELPLDYLSDDVDESEEFVFKPSNANLRIEPSSFKISDVYNGKYVTIYCDDVLTEDSIVEVKSSTDVTVGKLNVSKNSHHEDLTINIPVVKAYLTDDNSLGENVIDAELSKVAGLQGIEDYLNKKSLNQALIQVKFQYKDGEAYDWAFSKRSLMVANEGRNPRNNEEDYDYRQFEGMVTDEKTMKVNSGQILNFFHHQFKLKGENVINQKNVILYMTSLSTGSAGGSSFAVPLDNKHCIIYKPNLDHISSYAHEISHTLGLLHTFPEEKYKDKAAFLKKVQDSIIKSEKNKAKNSKLARSHPYIKYINKRIKKKKDKLSGYQTLFSLDKYKFTKKKTSNIMDYDLSDQKYFFKYQVNIMQDEVTKYYH